MIALPNALHFNADTQVSEILSLRTQPEIIQYYPRQTIYGEPDAVAYGLTPVESIPNIVIVEKDLQAAIEHAHAQRTMPMYLHQQTWAPEGFYWYQNGLGYCWTWGGCATLKTTYAMEGREVPDVAPVSMGYLVGWANRGNFMESIVQGLRERGACTAPNGERNSTNRSASYWEQHEDTRQLFLLDQCWDTDARDQRVMALQCASILCYGRPLAVAYDWWGHLLELIGVLWTPGTWMNLTWVLQNSHGEKKLITLEGKKGTPSEAAGFISSRRRAA